MSGTVTLLRGSSSAPTLIVGDTAYPWRLYAIRCPGHQYAYGMRNVPDKILEMFLLEAMRQHHGVYCEELGPVRLMREEKVLFERLKAQEPEDAYLQAISGIDMKCNLDSEEVAMLAGLLERAMHKLGVAQRAWQ